MLDKELEKQNADYLLIDNMKQLFLGEITLEVYVTTSTKIRNILDNIK